MDGWGARLLMALLLAAVGCRAAAPAPATPAAPALPTSATAGGTSIVAIAPPSQPCCPKQTLPQFLGITGACEGIKGLLNRLRNRLGAIWPGLEAKPEILALTDPANLESPNPAVSTAAAVKAEEDAAAQKAKAIAYLASVGCAGCYPGIEEALLAALDDCTELVRFETAKALRSTAQYPCKNCCRSACCGPKIREKLEKIAYETDEQGCYLESSDRVRRMARLALAYCGCVPPKPGQQPTLPQEGPGPEEGPPAAVASVLLPPGNPPAPAGGGQIAASSAPPIGSGLLISEPPAQAQQPAAARPVNYDEALRAFSSRQQAAAAPPVQAAFEIWTARPGDFASRGDAVSALTLARVQIMSTQPGQVLPPQLVPQRFDWIDPAQLRSPEIARAVATMPIGGVSGVIEDRSGWHLVRVLARREAPHPVQPAAAVQPVDSNAGPPALRVTSHSTREWPTAVPRVALPAANCDCK